LKELTTTETSADRAVAGVRRESGESPVESKIYTGSCLGGYDTDQSCRQNLGGIGASNSAVGDSIVGQGNCERDTVRDTADGSAKDTDGDINGDTDRNTVRDTDRDTYRDTYRDTAEVSARDIVKGSADGDECASQLSAVATVSTGRKLGQQRSLLRGTTPRKMRSHSTSSSSRQTSAKK
jgi:hypothetical protein